LCDATLTFAPFKAWLHRAARDVIDNTPGTSENSFFE